MTRRKVVHSVAVYDGRTYLGDVAELVTGQFAAVGPEGEDLGAFDEKRSAELTVLNLRSPPGRPDAS